jgi:carbon-monoxide dehydrogenase catalytic subunit
LLPSRLWETSSRVFHAAAHGKAPGYQLKDEQKLLQLALEFGIKIGDRSNEDIAKDIAEMALKDFTRQEGELNFIKRAPLKRQEIWRQLGVVPRGIDREVCEVMHSTHMGCDQDYRSLLSQATKVSLADGWGGSMLATELQDIMLVPSPVLSQINLGF